MDKQGLIYVRSAACKQPPLGFGTTACKECTVVANKRKLLDGSDSSIAITLPYLTIPYHTTYSILFLPFLHMFYPICLKISDNFGHYSSIVATNFCEASRQCAPLG